MAISKERMVQLQGLANKIKENPELQSQIMGGGQPQDILPPRKALDIAQKAGVRTKAGFGKSEAQAIEEGSLPFQQKQVERSRGRAGILPTTGLGGLQQAPIGQFEEIPTGVSPTGAIETKIERTPEAKLDQREREAELESDIQVKTAEKKVVQKTRTDLTNARLKIGNIYDSFLDVADRTMKITGVQPGPLGGVLSVVLGATKANEFVNAFNAGSIEYGAAIGRIAIPGARAVRLVNLFKQTAPGKYDTIESGVEQSALSYRNALASAIASDPGEFFPELVGKRLTEEDFEFIDDKLREFQNSYREGLFELAYRKNPQLLGVTKRNELEKKLGMVSKEDTDLNALIDELEAVGG